MANEKRLIDANALIKEANSDRAYGYVDAKQIADAPTIDAVEVVRCKDCKYFKTRLCENEDNYDDWFCADGERKNEVSE